MLADKGRCRVIVAITHTTAGGLLELWQDLAAGLRERGFTVDLLALYPSDRGEMSAMQEFGWHYIAPARPRTPLQAVRFAASLARYLRQAGPCTIISAMPLANAMLAMFGRMLGAINVIATHHIPLGEYGRVSAWLDRVAGRLTNMRRIVAVSHAVRDSLIHHAPEAKLATITNALPKAVERQLTRLRAARHPEPATGDRLIAVGRLSRQKNYPVLLRAMALLPDVCLDIFGEGEDGEALQHLAAELGLGERVVFHGLQPRPITLQHASRAAGFVQMSLYEGHSLALIEAAKLGLPLIVSDVASQVEGVTDLNANVCGIVIPCHDHQALSAAIASLISDPVEHARWSVRALELGQCSKIDEMIARYEELIMEANPILAGQNMRHRRSLQDIASATASDRKLETRHPLGDTA